MRHRQFLADLRDIFGLNRRFGPQAVIDCRCNDATGHRGLRQQQERQAIRPARYRKQHPVRRRHTQMIECNPETRQKGAVSLALRPQLFALRADFASGNPLGQPTRSVARISLGQFAESLAGFGCLAQIG